MAKKRVNNAQTGVVYLRGIHKSTKAKFKALCASHDVTLTDALEGLMILFGKRPQMYEQVKLNSVIEKMRQNREAAVN